MITIFKRITIKKRMNNPKVKPEKNQIFCTFYQRIGACMHGETCSRMHVHPSISKTILLTNFYPNPLKVISMLPENTLIIDPNTLDRNFDEFYLDIYEELRQYGPIEDFLVAANLCDHLVGNVLVRYSSEEDALIALQDLKSRFYAGRPIDAQFSPVYNFDEAMCKQFFSNQCQHGDNCNFIHPRFPSDYIMQQCPLIEKRPNGDIHIDSSNLDEDKRHNRPYDSDSNSRDRSNRKEREHHRGRSSRYDFDYSDDDTPRHHRGSRSSRYDDRRDFDDRYGYHDRRERRDDRYYRDRDDDRQYESSNRYSSHDDRRRYQQMPAHDQMRNSRHYNENDQKGRFDDGRGQRNSRDDYPRRRSYDRSAY